MFIGQIDQALFKKLKRKYKHKFVNVSRVEKCRQRGENSPVNRSVDDESVDESEDGIVTTPRNIREHETKETSDDSETGDDLIN